MSGEQLAIRYYVRDGLEEFYEVESLSSASRSAISLPKVGVVPINHSSPATLPTQSGQSGKGEVSKCVQTHIPFFGLPNDIRRLVTDQLFTSYRHDLKLDLEINTYKRSDEESSPIYFRLHLPQDFLHLFVSKQFFQEAVESFIHSTSIHLGNCDAIELFNGIEKGPSFKFVLQRILTQSTYAAIDCDCDCEPSLQECQLNTIRSLSMYVNKVKKIDIFHNDLYNWLRLADDSSYVTRNTEYPADAPIHYIGTSFTELETFAAQKSYPYAMKEDLQIPLFEGHAFQSAQALAESLRVDGREVVVHFWVTVYCHIYYAILTDEPPNAMLSFGLTPDQPYTDSQQPIVSRCHYRTVELAELALT